MNTVNYVEVQGYVGRDAEKKSEKAPVKFSIATGNDSKSDGSGKNPLLFHSITAWTNQFPEAVNIKKGELVRVTGRLNYQKWTGKDGVERTGTEIVASSITVNPKPQEPITPNPYKTQVADKDIPF
jgi:single-strand DNA-binding protein